MVNQKEHTIREVVKKAKTTLSIVKIKPTLVTTVRKLKKKPLSHKINSQST